MDISTLSLTYIGGPTAVIEIAGLRFLTDPTFDPAGSEYTTPVYTLRKMTGPAIVAANIGEIDAVLLSHDHHFDNLDRSGHALLPSARRVLTTTEYSAIASDAGRRLVRPGPITGITAATAASFPNVEEGWVLGTRTLWLEQNTRTRSTTVLEHTSDGGRTWDVRLRI